MELGGAQTLDDGEEGAEDGGVLDGEQQQHSGARPCVDDGEDGAEDGCGRNGPR
jgi:hypothetical protein